MKPRLKRHHGVWHCYLPGQRFHITCGLGYRPEVAYWDWKRMVEKYPETQADSCVQLKG